MCVCRERDRKLSGHKSSVCAENYNAEWCFTMLKHLIKSKIASIWLVARSPSYSITFCALSLNSMHCNPNRNPLQSPPVCYVCAGLFPRVFFSKTLLTLRLVRELSVPCEAYIKYRESSHAAARRINEPQQKKSGKKRANREAENHSNTSRRARERERKWEREPFGNRFNAICTVQMNVHLMIAMLLRGSFDCRQTKLSPLIKATIIDKIIVQRYCFTASSCIFIFFVIIILVSFFSLFVFLL